MSYEKTLKLNCIYTLANTKTRNKWQILSMCYEFSIIPRNNDAILKYYLFQIWCSFNINDTFLKLKYIIRSRDHIFSFLRWWYTVVYTNNFNRLNQMLFSLRNYLFAVEKSCTLYLVHMINSFWLAIARIGGAKYIETLSMELSKTLLIKLIQQIFLSSA